MYCDHHHYQQLEDSKFFMKLGSDKVKYFILVFTYQSHHQHTLLSTNTTTECTLTVNLFDTWSYAAHFTEW